MKSLIKILQSIFIVTTFFMGACFHSFAELSIQITQGNVEAIPVAVVPFATNSEQILPVNIAEVISYDLKLSGQFQPISQDNFLSFPTSEKNIFYPDWKKLRTRYLIVGKSYNIDKNKYKIEYSLVDIHRKQSILTGVAEGLHSQLRPIAHNISDQIYQKITGIRGIFSTKLLYVLVKDKGKENASYHLVYSDIDGKRPVIIASLNHPIISPAWSPDHKKIAYASYTKKLESVVYLQHLATGKREILVQGRSLITSPAFSPDGSKVAMSISDEDSSHIYIKDLKTGYLKKLTNEPYVLDAEPSWSPDGRNIVFTSNRGGTAQIYMLNLSSLKVQRLTFSGHFNARATFLPDGEQIVFVTKKEGTRSYHIAIMNLKTGVMRVLSTEPFEDSPKVAPNGQMLVFSSFKKNYYVLGMVTVDGQTSYEIPSESGDVQEPAWSPFM